MIYPIIVKRDASEDEKRAALEGHNLRPLLGRQTDHFDKAMVDGEKCLLAWVNGPLEGRPWGWSR